MIISIIIVKFENERRSSHYKPFINRHHHSKVEHFLYELLYENILDKKTYSWTFSTSTFIKKKNFTDAYNAASSHIEYWIGAGVSFISMMILSRVYDFLLPAQDTFPGDIIRSLCVVCPSILIWFQFSVYVMRKYYRHILVRGKETETISERLIREADTREYELWRPVRRFFSIVFLIVLLGCIHSLITTIK